MFMIQKDEADRYCPNDPKQKWNNTPDSIGNVVIDPGGTIREGDVEINSPTHCKQNTDRFIAYVHCHDNDYSKHNWQARKEIEHQGLQRRQPALIC